MAFWDNVQYGLEVAVSALESYERGQQIFNLVLGDQGVIGTLNRSGAIDFYRVFLPTYGNYLFQMTQPVFTDFDLFVLSVKGDVIASDRSENNPSVVHVSGSGHCFVAVKSARGIGRYSLMFRYY